MQNLDAAQLAAVALSRRQKDGLRMFRALSPQMDPSFPDQVSFFEDDATETLLTGGNRGGKSLCAAVSIAAAARDIPVTTWDGRQIDLRRPWQKNRVLQIWIIGLKIEHFSTIFRLLFRRGVYKIIRDNDTGEMRAWRPWCPVDAARRKECQPSYPLIPGFEVDPKSWSWEQKSSRQFTHVLLPGKAEIWCFPSTAREPRQGEPVDRIWVDERIEHHSHYPDWQMRLADEDGSLLWSSMPKRHDPALMDLRKRAIEQAQEVREGKRQKADVTQHVFPFEANPFISADVKRKRREGMSKEEWDARNLGLFNEGEVRIYPFFDRSLHAAIPADRDNDDKIARILRENNGLPPADWTHELIIDPGTRRPAVLFGAVPPPELWDGTHPILVAYRELYGERLTAEDIAARVRQLTLPGVMYNRFIIDNQAARQTPMSFGLTIGENFSQAFTRERLSCRESGTFFTPGNNSPEIRRNLMNNVLASGANGRPRFRIVTENCPHLVHQMATNELQEVNGFISDKERGRQENDIRMCGEYWVSRSPTYVRPKSVQAVWDDGFDAAIEDIFGSKKKSTIVRAGPGSLSAA